MRRVDIMVGRRVGREGRAILRGEGVVVWCWGLGIGKGRESEVRKARNGV